jgi:hypothetical protein
MKTEIKQIKNENGTFQYVKNGKIIVNNSKKDYSFYLDEIGSFSNSIKSITSTQNYWIKYGNNDVNKNNLNIIEIIK